jgi:hypothetical protein
MTSRFIGNNILVLSCSRSGHHAVINWLIQQSKGIIKYHNNCELGWDKGMFKPIKRNVESIGVTSDNFVTNVYTIEDFNMEYCTQYNFFNFTSLPQYKIDLVIIINRDFRNWISSRIKGGGEGLNNLISVKNSNTPAVKKWEMLVKESLGETRLLKGNSYNINFNRWYDSDKYRKQVCLDLGLEFSDNGLREVNDAGGGSSFSGTQILDSKNLDVLNRYKEMESNEKYKNILSSISPEIIELDKKYFKKEWKKEKQKV